MFCNDPPHLFFVAQHVEMAKLYGGRSSSNIVVPNINIDGKPGEMPHIAWLVIIQDPADAARLACNHVRKTPGYSNTFLRNGVLSTPDNASWAKQRHHVVSVRLFGEIVALCHSYILYHIL